MAFFKRVNLLGPAGEQLSGWVKESCGAIGAVIRVREDEDYGRDWTVTEAGPQLVVESQIQPAHMLNAYFPGQECNLLTDHEDPDFPLPAIGPNDAYDRQSLQRPTLKKKVSRLKR